MIIHSAQFLRGYVYGQDTWDVSFPQIAFYGRSNAGKSSTINKLLGRNSLAKSSGTPGKTKEINFFSINNEITFVDLPGYGYAKVSKVEREKLEALIRWYAFETHAVARMNVFVLDAKVGVTDTDKEFLLPLVAEGKSVMVLLNKIDKLNQKERNHILSATREDLGEGIIVLPFSARTGRGVKEFWNHIVSPETK
ncbi:MAG: ribosome biogenesis GTP-binding protein YihA/YsxC [Candidatus Paceibacterota bacterium]